MTKEEFAVAYPPGPGDSIVECRCGALDCPGWKIWNREQAKRELDALERLPEVFFAAAERAGQAAAEARERRIIELLTNEAGRGDR
jgi:hypothetical protein